MLVPPPSALADVWKPLDYCSCKDYVRWEAVNEPRVRYQTANSSNHIFTADEMAALEAISVRAHEDDWDTVHFKYECNIGPVVEEIVSMGFSEREVRKALHATEGEQNAAVKCLLMGERQAPCRQEIIPPAILSKRKTRTDAEVHKDSITNENSPPMKRARVESVSGSTTTEVTSASASIGKRFFPGYFSARLSSTQRKHH